MPSFKITLTVTSSRPRLDQVLLEALRAQSENHRLKHISRSDFKALFKDKKIRIKGQNALPSSSLASGNTEIEILI